MATGLLRQCDTSRPFQGNGAELFPYGIYSRPIDKYMNSRFKNDEQVLGVDKNGQARGERDRIVAL